MKALILYVALFTTLPAAAFPEQPVAHEEALCGNLLPDYDPGASDLGSTYVPMDSWLYPAIDRLHALGYVDIAYLDMKPWTRASIGQMLEASSDEIGETAEDSNVCLIYHAIQHELKPEILRQENGERSHAAIEDVYTRFRGISGTPLRDSYHLGQTIVNDYGRPYQHGFNSVNGVSAVASAGRFSLYVRAEYQHAPSAAGYSSALAALLSANDGIPFAANPVQSTIPLGPIATANNLRVINANISYLLFHHEISFGKSDHWMGPAQGGSFAWSTNAENLYAFQVDRVEPLRIPLLSQVTGPFRYQFFVGSLKGHTIPNAPWVHAEKISFKPTANLELGFERSVIWGGKGHVPITVGSFLKSFFSFQDVSSAEKVSRSDPGARFGTFDFTYRVPYLRQWLTLYTDSLAHDDVSPVSAPRRAGIRPGVYLSQFPKWHALDLRVEAASTDPPTARSNSGQFLYWEQIQKQGYTNKGFTMGDWVGRESKGGQAWLTYHLSPREQMQLSYRNAKAAKDFIPGGTTQNDITLSARKIVGRHFEFDGSLQYETWKAPIYLPQKQTDLSTSLQICWQHW